MWLLIQFQHNEKGRKMFLTQFDRYRFFKFGSETMFISVGNGQTTREIITF